MLDTDMILATASIRDAGHHYHWPVLTVLHSNNLQLQDILLIISEKSSAWRYYDIKLVLHTDQDLMLLRHWHYHSIWRNIQLYTAYIPIMPFQIVPEIFERLSLWLLSQNTWFDKHECVPHFKWKRTREVLSTKEHSAKPRGKPSTANDVFGEK